MSLYQKINAAQNNKNIRGQLDLLQQKLGINPESTGTKVSKSEWTPTLMSMMQNDALSFNNQRCLYENDEIMVEHSFMTFPDGTSEAVLVVNFLQDGKIIRTETGATPIR